MVIEGGRDLAHMTAKAGLAILATLPFGAQAFAQTSGRSIDLRVGITSIYDSNASRSTRTSATSRNLRRADIRTMPNVNVIINQPFGRHNFTLTGLFGYDFYMHNSRLNRERINVTSRFTFDFIRCNADLSPIYNRNQTDLGSYGNATGSTATASVKNVETIRGADVSGSCGVTVGIRPTAGVSYIKSSNSNVLRQRNDHDTLSYNGGLSYVHPSLGTARVFVSRTETRFDNAGTGPLPRSDYNFMSYGVSVSRDIGAALSGSAQVSYSRVKSLQPNGRDSSGLNWSVDANLRASPRLQLSGQLSRKISSSLAVDSRYNVSTTYALSANYALTSRTQLQGSFSIRPRKIYGFQSATGPAILKDRFEQASLGVTFAQSQRLGFHARTTRDRRVAPGTFYDYTNYTAEIGADLKF